MTLKDLMKLSLDLILILSVMLDHLLLSPEQTICCIYQHGNIVPSHPPHTHFISQPFIFMFISHHGEISIFCRLVHILLLVLIWSYSRTKVLAVYGTFNWFNRLKALCLVASLSPRQPASGERWGENENTPW